MLTTLYDMSVSKPAGTSLLQFIQAKKQKLIKIKDRIGPSL